MYGTAAARVRKPPIRYGDHGSHDWMWKEAPCSWRGKIDIKFVNVSIRQLEPAGSWKHPAVVSKWRRIMRTGRTVPPLIGCATERGTFYIHDGNHRYEAMRGLFAGNPDAQVRVAQPRSDARVELLRAGVQAAQVALAAVERAGDQRAAGRREAERLHRAVRLDRVAEQVARAQLGAEAALVAGGAADPRDLDRRRTVPQHEGVRGGEDDDAAGRLRDRLVEAARGPRHHHAAEEDSDVRLGRPAGRGGVGAVISNGDGQDDFYWFYTQAKKGENGFKPYFFWWGDDPRRLDLEFPHQLLPHEV